MTAPKVLANTSIFDEVQLDNSFDATVYSSAAGDNASNSSLDESSSPSIPDAGAQIEAPNGAQIAGLFQSVSLSGAQHDVSVDLGDLSSVILAPLAFSTESNSSFGESAPTDAGDIVGALDLSAISPNSVPHSDFSTFAISPSGELTDAADASISGGLRGLVAGAETGSASPLDSHGSVPVSNFAFALASPESASPGLDFAVPTANLSALQAPVPAPAVPDQGGQPTTLPQGIAEVGDLGVFSASLAHTSSLGSSESGAGSLQAVSGEQSSGLVINIVWDTSVSNAPAAFKSVVESVVQFYESEFSNPVTLNIDVGWGEVAGSTLTSGSLGESENYVQSFSYSQILAALTQNVTDNAQLSAVNSLPSSAPVGGEFYMPLAEATALGLVTGSATLDGAVGFNSSVAYAYSDTNGVPGNEYDLYGIVAHEISEVMGRISLLTFNSVYSPLDLFRYAANGVPSFTASRSAYFSDNGGQTDLSNFNSSPYGDLGDLAGNTGGNSFNAFVGTGTVSPITANDLTMMNVLGYDLASSTAQLPKVTAIAETPGTGSATIGDVIHLSLNFSEAVSVSGTPTIALNDNGVATYTGGSGTSSLSFSYTVGSSDSNVSELNANAINLNGGSIHDTAGYNALLSLSGLTQTGPQIEASPLTQIDALYESVLQRAPTAAEITASTALDAATGSNVMTAAIVDSAEAITNVYPILQMFELAFGHFPTAATLASMVQADLNVPQLSAAVVASQTFANAYNGGSLIDPNSPVTSGIVEALYQQALGYAPTQATLDSWLNGGLTVEQAFQEMVSSQSYFSTTQNNIEQYLTQAVNSVAGGASSGTGATGAAGSLSANQIDGIYEAVLQRAPTSTEVTASQALDSATGDAATVATVVNSAEAITNVYPVLQMFELAFRHLPTATTLASMVQSELTVTQLSTAVVASQTFANTYNGGVLMDPNAPVTGSVVETLYTQALGHAPTQATLNTWLNSGLSTAEAFQEMVTSQSYFQTTQAGLQQYLSAAADNAVSAHASDVSASIIGSNPTSEILAPHPMA
jgi:hypothetical protein